jgi:pantoate--beta-alanine ligase
MKIFHAAGPLRRTVRMWRCQGKTVGFVPTMGALHEGHVSLIHRARAENDRVVVSVFVNPTQFGPGEDLTRYPRPFRQDAALCRSAVVDALLAPRSFYPPDYQTWVTVDTLSQPLCGRFRPGHFRGVATVVLKLFNVVQPDRAYFGQKDFQQWRLIERMARDLDVPVKVVGCPTVRDKAGLALSSRNAYLSAEERAAAPLLARSLRDAGQVLKSGRGAAAARRAARAVLGRIGAARIQYLDVVDPVTLGASRPDGPWLVAAAVYVGRTRLIDNRWVKP